MSQLRLNAYRIMWLFVFFDLPVRTKKDRKQYSEFRRKLQQDGFTMMQYSVYTRHCASRENAAVHIQRVKKMLPPRGMVSILQITDRQYGDILNFWGKERKKPEKGPPQLQLF